MEIALAGTVIVKQPDKPGSTRSSHAEQSVLLSIETIRAASRMWLVHLSSCPGIKRASLHPFNAHYWEMRSRCAGLLLAAPARCAVLMLYSGSWCSSAADVTHFSFCHDDCKVNIRITVFKLPSIPLGICLLMHLIGHRGACQILSHGVRAEQEPCASLLHQTLNGPIQKN